MNTAEKIIKRLGLEPLPEEGGYFRQTYKSPLKTSNTLKNGDSGVRSLGTEIFYLVTPSEFSALHRISSDEIFHFYLGDPVEMLQINESGASQKIILGPKILDGQEVQVVVPSATWQGTRLVRGGNYALLGTTVIPGFEFSDFELGNRDLLTTRFLHLKEDIRRYTKY